MPDYVRRTVSTRVWPFLLEVFQLILLAVAFVVRWLYRLLFSWWLNPLFDRWIEKAFADEIRQAMPFLFYRYGGRVVSDPRPEANDRGMDYVSIGTRNVILKFGRWRRENYEVRVSPNFAPTDSYELADVLCVADSTANAQAFPKADSWRVLSRFLEPRFHFLETAFSKDNFQGTKHKIAKLRLMSGPG